MEYEAQIRRDLPEDANLVQMLDRYYDLLELGLVKDWRKLRGGNGRKARPKKK